MCRLQWASGGLCALCVATMYIKNCGNPFLNGDSPQSTRETSRMINMLFAILKADAEIVGHLLRELSKICCLFILHGGRIIAVVKRR